MSAKLQKAVMSTVQGFKRACLRSFQLIYKKVFRRQRLKVSRLNDNLSIVGVDSSFHRKIIHDHTRKNTLMYTAYPENSRISNTSYNCIGIDSSFHRKFIHGQ